MDVVPLTLTISLCLVFTFVVFFLREHGRGRLSSVERDSLLPLAEETPRLVPVRVAVAAAPVAHDHADEVDHDNCGCRDGSRPPCMGCLKGHAHR